MRLQDDCSKLLGALKSFARETVRRLPAQTFVAPWHLNLVSFCVLRSNLSSQRVHIFFFCFTCCKGQAKQTLTWCGSCTANNHLYLVWTTGEEGRRIGYNSRRREKGGCGGGTKASVFKSTWVPRVDVVTSPSGQKQFLRHHGMIFHFSKQHSVLLHQSPFFVFLFSQWLCASVGPSFPFIHSWLQGARVHTVLYPTPHTQKSTIWPICPSAVGTVELHCEGH